MKYEYNCSISEANQQLDNHISNIKRLYRTLDSYDPDEDLNNDDVFDYLALLSQADGKLSKRTGLI